MLPNGSVNVSLQNSVKKQVKENSIILTILHLIIKYLYVPSPVSSTFAKLNNLLQCFVKKNIKERSEWMKIVFKNLQWNSGKNHLIKKSP